MAKPRTHYVRTDRDDGTRQYTGPLDEHQAYVEAEARIESFPTYNVSVHPRDEVESDVRAYDRAVGVNDDGSPRRYYPVDHTSKLSLPPTARHLVDDARASGHRVLVSVHPGRIVVEVRVGDDRYSGTWVQRRPSWRFLFGTDGFDERMTITQLRSFVVDPEVEARATGTTSSWSTPEKIEESRS